MKLIARNREIEELGRLYKSKRSEFVIVYGRRRIGKTFLVNQVFQERFTFTYVGARKQPQRVQLQRFARQLQDFSGSPYCPTLNSWEEAFEELKALIKTKPLVSGGGPYTQPSTAMLNAPILAAIAVNVSGFFDLFIC